jgi:ribosomal protein S18 acetylase RimI-like enzyme
MNAVCVGRPVLVTEASFTGAVAQGLLSAWTQETGLTPTGGSTVAPEDFAAPDGAFFIALDGAAPVGCGGLRRLDDRTGEVKRLFVKRMARGHGAGRALMDAIEARAAALAMTRLRLDTRGDEQAALALFRSRGYREIADYNGNERARWWFEKALTATPSTAPAPRTTGR